jgi:hypothetical protein
VESGNGERARSSVYIAAGDCRDGDEFPLGTSFARRGCQLLCAEGTLRRAGKHHEET